MNKQLIGYTMNEQQLTELRQRNEDRAKQKIAEMGERWLCHSANRVTRSSFKNQVDSSYAKSAR